VVNRGLGISGAGRFDAGAVLLAAALLGVLGAPRLALAEDGTSPALTDSMAQSIEQSAPSESAPPSTQPERPPLDVPPGRFVAEVLDSTYFIEPAEFFALDLPVRAQGGAMAAHMLGDVSVVGGRHDIIVRLFRSGDYQNWLKRRGGRQAGPIWSSPRQRVVHLDQELPQGTPLVLLLDNGYSLRTPKRVRVQVQLQYQGEGGAMNISAQPASRAPQEGDITPRSNSDEEFPPPPPPPPSEDGK
jgi:hypothetical protein